MDFFNTPANAPNLQSYTPPTLASGLNQYLGQQSQLGAVQNFATAQNQGANTAYQQMLYGTSPTLQGNMTQFGNNTQSLLNGQIPADVAAQVQNSAAYSSLMGGFGGSNMAHALTARDLGQTSLSLQQQGAANLGQQSQMTAALNPSNIMPSQLFYSPSTILSREDQSALINNQVQDQNDQINYQNSLQRSPFDQLMTNNLATLAGIATNPLDAYAAMQGGGQQTVSNMGVLNSTGGGGGGGGMGSMGSFFGGGGSGGFSGTTGSPSQGSSGGGGGIAGMASMCCFIFLESLNGQLPEFARKARDTRGTNATIRGYRWMSCWLVPAMRVSSRVTTAVNTFMVHPMLACGRDYFTEEKSVAGKCCKPFVAFWFSVWTLLGLTVGRKERGRDECST